jgi:hypothetical protein
MPDLVGWLDAILNLKGKPLGFLEQLVQVALFQIFPALHKL